jgi:hypothetical protein
MNCDTVHHQARVEADEDNYIHLILPGWYNYFVVPEGAIEEDTTITIAVTRYHYWDDQTFEYSLVAFFEFGPDGLTFGGNDGDDDHDNWWHYGGSGDWDDDDDDDDRWHHGGSGDWDDDDDDDDWRHYGGYGSWHTGDEELPYLVLHASWLDLHYGDEAVLRYYNEDTGLWEQISSTSVSRGRIQFEFEHFSRYAISR